MIPRAMLPDGFAIIKISWTTRLVKQSMALPAAFCYV